MLTRAERLTSADDFTRTVRRGVRASAGAVVIYSRSADGLESSRFGFIVSKKVGNAVVRNTVKRRLRGICASFRGEYAISSDVVIRALPQAGSQTYSVLYDEVARGLRKVAVLR